ncbi:DUF1285 domain-containing protein [Aestuariirhabdus litorea]|uniref:DUF1285 domain-containing protein n=1 Tax=Aestuariirhabdus litorea TaxID=2528527 RepID=A0A3P3VQL8_9GAMM|nr:DUF1285 domain-containing protein [Aestuariirhabdus litorea]RRJ84754.1 DUF1285 domain-containing protein [Aestuariirhabdus litorea]RWW97979.1 DUF1285 domain-containing protein [Endozoicomonadaceae bacterium GTF-13]
MASTPGTLARALADVLPKQGVPPVDSWHPEVEGDSQMRIDRNGDWFYQSTPIERAGMVRLFSTILRRDGEDYFLVTPVEKLSIQVDDLPFVVVDVGSDPVAPERLLFITNLGDRIPLDRSHPLEVEGIGRSEIPPSIRVRGALKARIHRNLFYHLVEHHGVERTIDGRPHLGVLSEGEYHSLGELADS